MTLIAFSTSRYTAEVITDSLTYTPTGHRMGLTSSKGDLVPDLDLMVLSRGSVDFHRAWLKRLHVLVRDGLTTIDELHQVAPDELRRGWADYERWKDEQNATFGAHATAPATAIFHVGYSPAQERFVAHGYDSETGFEPLDLTAGHVMPAPTGTRPSDAEMRRLRATLLAHRAGDEEETRELHAMFERLAAEPAFVPPTTRAGWGRLARQIRQDRALAHVAGGMKTPVGGDVTMTRLRRGAFDQRTLLTFDDSGEELVQLVSGSLHPLAQHAACPWCDSGRPYVDCCLSEHVGRPCPCRSGRLFEACCSVHADQHADATPALATV